MNISNNFNKNSFRIKSFVRRSGRLSKGQKNAIKNFSKEFSIPFSKNFINYENEFKNKKNVILEIGTGMGETITKMAADMPNKNFLGVEVYKPGIGSLLKKIKDFEINNILIINQDVVDVLDLMIPPMSLEGINIFFPDPWHKFKHNKRRLIQTPFIKLISSRLKKSGYIHCTTDCKDYADQINKLFNLERSLENILNNCNLKPAFRPTTKFEKKALEQGHNIWDFNYKKL